MRVAEFQQGPKALHAAQQKTVARARAHVRTDGSYRHEPGDREDPDQIRYHSDVRESVV